MSTVQLGEDLGIENSADLKQMLAPLLASDTELRLDAGQVRRIHTASVQVLCAFVDTRRKDGKRTVLKPATTLSATRHGCWGSAPRWVCP